MAIRNPRVGWGTTIHRCQGQTIGNGEINRYVVISPGTRAFESRNPGALYVAMSRAKTAGGTGQYPDFAFNPHILVNEDRLCHRVSTPTTKARKADIERLTNLTSTTMENHVQLNTDEAFQMFIQILEQEE